MADTVLMKIQGEIELLIATGGKINNIY